MRLPLTVLNSGESDGPPLRLAHTQELTPEQVAYDRAVRDLVDTRYIDFPRAIGLETLVRCNAACDFCPYPGLERKGDRMDDALVGKFVEELADIPEDLPVSIVPCRINEPFLDKRVLPMLEEIDRRYPNCYASIFSNGSTFTAKFIERLGGIQRISLLNISFNDHREDAYEKTMQIPFARTVRNLDLLHEAFDGGSLSAPAVSISRVGDGTDADGAFLEWCRSRWPRFTPRVSPRMDWLGDLRLGWVSTPPAITCGQFFKLQFLASGRAGFCCVDATGNRGVGDLREQHLLEIYNLPERRALRTNLVSRDRVPTCGTCSVLA
jgi:hypothetical protein